MITLSEALSQDQYPQVLMTTVDYYTNKHSPLPRELSHIKAAELDNSSVRYWARNYLDLDSEHAMLEDQQDFVEALARDIAFILERRENSALLAADHTDRREMAIINELAKSYPNVKVFSYSIKDGVLGLRQIHCTHNPDYMKRFDSADCEECGDNFNYCDCEDY